MVFIRTDRAPICVRGLGIPLAFPAYVFTGYPYFGRETRPFLFSKNCLIGGACNTHLHHSIFKEQRNFCGREEARTPESPPWQGGILTNWTTRPVIYLCIHSNLNKVRLFEKCTILIISFLKIAVWTFTVNNLKTKNYEQKTFNLKSGWELIAFSPMSVFNHNDFSLSVCPSGQPIGRGLISAFQFLLAMHQRLSHLRLHIAEPLLIFLSKNFHNTNITKIFETSKFISTFFEIFFIVVLKTLVIQI